MKIGFRITLLMIVMSLLSVGILGTVLISRTWKNADQLAIDLTQSTVRHMASEFQTFIDTNWQKVASTLIVMEKLQSLPSAQRRPFVNDVLRGMLEKHSYIVSTWSTWDLGAMGDNDRAWIGTPGVDDQGRFVPYFFRTGTEISMDALDDIDTGNYNLEPRRRGRQIITNPYLYTLAGQEIVMASIAAPIRNRENEIIGVIGIDIDLNQLNSIAQNIGSLDKWSRKSASLSAAFSNNGTIISHFEHERIGRDFRETEGDIVGENIDFMADAIKSGQELKFDITVDGATFWFFVEPVRIFDFPDSWAIALARPLNEVHAKTYEMIWFSVILCLIIQAAIIGAAMWMSRSIALPIRKMANTLKDIATGDGDLTVSLPDSGSDEIGEASRFFNQTIKKIRALVISIKEQASSLSDIGNDLASNMTETASAMNEIAANLQSIKGRVLNQSASVTETSATMEQVTGNIDKLDDFVDRQTEAVMQSSSAIEQMLANIQSVTATLTKNSKEVLDLQGASESGRSSLQEVAADIQEISRDSEGLLEINTVMENIASQTNLLSMNAAIEAAHAGELGKGFAVVADEIRKLAEDSSEQSKTIGEVLRKIKDSIDKITRSTDSVISDFQAIDSGVKSVAHQGEEIRSAMEEQSEGSQQVLEASAQVSQITQQVKGGSQQMLEGSKEVIEESRNLEMVTLEITNGINEMASGAEQVNKAINSVNELSGKNRKNISDLVKAVSQFKV